MQNDAHLNPPLTTMAAQPSGRVRTTIAVDPDVYEAFADMAEASGASLSRCIGDWLRDTAEAAQITTVKLREVRQSPQQALQAFIRDGMVPEMLRITRHGAAPTWGVGGTVERGRSDGRGRGAAEPQPGAAGATGRALIPPSSNTGGKVPGKNPRSRS